MSIPEIESEPQLAELLARDGRLRGRRIQGVDLECCADALLARSDLEGLVVLGGHVPKQLAEHLGTHGALIFPTDPTAPVDPYRATLYTADELYAGLDDGYDSTADARAYHWSRDASIDHDAFVTLLRAIHDDSISDALAEIVVGRQVVGVMGGHAMARDSKEYAGAAQLGHELAALGFVVATGGGPGAMEAANLGAFAPTPGLIEEVLALLADPPLFAPSVNAWAQSAMEARDILLTAREETESPSCSVGIPTWFYGHEPSNVFCTGIAKYFSNALREDDLISRSNAGIIILSGAAGTVQEIFQAVTPLYYARLGDPLPRLVLVGVEHWTRTVPVWPALRALASGREMRHRLHLVDTITDAIALFVEP